MQTVRTPTRHCLLLEASVSTLYVPSILHDIAFCHKLEVPVSTLYVPSMLYYIASCFVSFHIDICSRECYVRNHTSDVHILSRKWQRRYAMIFVDVLFPTLSLLLIVFVVVLGV